LPGHENTTLDFAARQGAAVELSMDGPHVFKGEPLEASGSKRYV